MLSYFLAAVDAEAAPAGTNQPGGPREIRAEDSGERVARELGQLRQRLFHTPLLFLGHPPLAFFLLRRCGRHRFRLLHLPPRFLHVLLVFPSNLRSRSSRRKLPAPALTRTRTPSWLTRLTDT